MNLGELIDALEKCKQDADVEFDFCYFEPGPLHSYRGYYEDLAIDLFNVNDHEHDCPTVGSFLDELKGAVGKQFEGYKGGTYTMHRDTRVWVAQYSRTSGTVIVRVEDTKYNVTLHTAKVD